MLQFESTFINYLLTKRKSLQQNNCKLKDFKHFIKMFTGDQNIQYNLNRSALTLTILDFLSD